MQSKKKNVVATLIFLCWGEMARTAKFANIVGKPTSSELYFNEEDCGVVHEDIRDQRTLIPWNAAVFQKTDAKFLFAGTIVSPRVILTVGNYFWKSTNNQLGSLDFPVSHNLVVVVGLKSSKLEERDANSQLVEVLSVQPHPASLNSTSHEHDIAVIHLKETLNLTSPFARAACVPVFINDIFSPKIGPGSAAIHVGFGYEPRQDAYPNFERVNVQFMSEAACIKKCMKLNCDAPTNVYCTEQVQVKGKTWKSALSVLSFPFRWLGQRERKEESPPCNSNAAGLVVKFEKRYYIIGLNSMFTLTASNGTCNRSSFRKLQESLSWIHSVMACGPASWHCGNDQCVDVDRVCDLNPDCRNGSDEDANYCGWANPSSGCGPIPKEEGLKIVYNRAQQQPDSKLARGTRATLFCERYYTSIKPKVKLTCDNTGKWSPFPSTTFACQPDCGRAGKPKNNLIVNGSPTSRTASPWYAAIFYFHVDEKKYHYVCGGSLVHRSAVLTAAHCFHLDSIQVLEKSNFKVVLAPNSSVFQDNLKEGDIAEILDIAKVFIPDSFNIQTFKSDLALVQLIKPVHFTEQIRPVCFPSSSKDLRALEEHQLSTNNFGQVAGFGVDETGEISKSLRVAKLPVVSSQTCLDQLNHVASKDTYCAGYNNGTSVCNGDSGGGMVFSSGTGASPRFYLQGIVSFGPITGSSDLCDAHSIAVFTRVGFFSDWIYEQLYKIESTIT